MGIEVADEEMGVESVNGAGRVLAPHRRLVHGLAGEG